MKQEIKSAITRGKILNSAENEFALKGLSAAKVDDIASNAGVNKKLIYSHYKSKELLYAEVLKSVYGRLSDYEDTLEDRSFHGRDDIRSVILDYFEFLTKNPNFVRLVLWENLNYAKYTTDIKSSLFHGIKKLLKKGIESGIIRESLDIEQTALSMNMFCFSAFSNIYTISKITGKDLFTEPEMQKRAEHIADVLTEYIFSK